MPNVARTKSFWKVLTSVSVAEIERDAKRPFSLALVGTPEARHAALSRLFPGIPSESASPLLRAFDSTDAATGFSAEPGAYDLVVDSGGGRASDYAGPVFSVDELGGWERTIERVLDERPDLALSLGRRFPGLRETIAARMIRETALTNAQFAMINALPGMVPLLGLLIPTAVLGDIFILAKNQAMMLFRLAALHDLPLDIRSRGADLAPLLGNAFGWRAIAREAVGFVPGGVGLVARGAIAYAGTAALGEAVRRYHALGQEPSRGQIALLYREAYADARTAVAGVARKLRSVRGRRPMRAIAGTPPAAEPPLEGEVVDE